MAKAKTKAAGTNLPVPQSDAEAEQLIAQLGALDIEFKAEKAKHTEIVAEHGRTIASLNEAFSAKEAAFVEAKAAIVGGLNIYATANRERFTNGGKTKTFHFATGKVFWEESSYSVQHRPLTLVQVVVAIRERIAQLEEEQKVHRKARRNLEAATCRAKIEQLEGFLRTKVEPNKQAMLASPEARALAETVRGVTVPRGPEEFGVEPLASQIREVA